MNAELIWTVPLAGALVGWLTNVIAIEMLFRPKIPMYLLGMRIPFTPGLLPINQKQIIDSASKHVSSVIIDSLETSSQDANHLKLFNIINPTINKDIWKSWLTEIRIKQLQSITPDNY